MTGAVQPVTADVQPVVNAIDSLPMPDEPRRVALATVALRRGGAVVALIAVFALTLLLFTRNNDAPSWYHPDEAGKAYQVIDGQYRNFNHPLLLLEASALMTRIRHPQLDVPRANSLWRWRDPDPYSTWQLLPESETVIRDGRLVSATFGALTVAFFAAAGYVAFGWIGLLAAATVFALSPQLLVHSHDMKEDTALICGIGAVVAAAAIFWAKPARRWRAWSLPLLGMAAAIAPSGKYVGIVSLACAIPALFLAPPFSWWRTLLVRPVVFAATCALTLAVINHRAIEDWSRFRDGLDRETEHAMTGHSGVTMDRPNAFALETTWRQAGAHVWVLAAVFACSAAWSLKRARRASRDDPRPRGEGWWGEQGWQLVVVAFAIVVAATLSYNTIPFRRYALPITVLVDFFAALGAAALIARLVPAKHWWRVGAAVVVLGSIVALQLPACLDLNRQYTDDSRQRLRDWLNDHAPRGALVAGDRYAQLGSRADPRSPNARKRLIVRTAAIESFGRRGWFGNARGGRSMIDDLRRAGVRYVAISEPSYDRYLTRFARPEPGGEAEFERRRSFYATLLRDYTPVWESAQNYPNDSFVNPKIRLYDLSRPR